MSTTPTRRIGTGALVGGIVAVVVVVAAIVVIAVAASGDGTDLDQTQPVTVVGSPLPEMVDVPADPAIGASAPRINGAGFDGTPINVRPGTPTLLVFVAHWCPHCQAEVPVLVQWAADGGVPDGVDVIGVASGTDRRRPNYPPSEWLEAAGFPFPVLADTEAGTAASAFGLMSFPYFVLLDGDGTVAARLNGEVDPATLTALVDSVDPAA
ncbi:MAG: TlpA family protein disulfide reductase [Desertimonas sp.]